MDINGNPWKSLKIAEDRWKSQKIWQSMHGMHEIQSKSMEIHGNPSDASEQRKANSELRTRPVQGELRTSQIMWGDPGQRTANFVKTIAKATASEGRTSQNHWWIVSRRTKRSRTSNRSRGVVLLRALQLSSKPNSQSTCFGNHVLCMFSICSRSSYKHN